MFYGGSEDEKKGLREARLSEGDLRKTGGVETVRPRGGFFKSERGSIVVTESSRLPSKDIK